MGYAGTRIMCDADGHIMETFDWLKTYADPDIRDALPGLKLGGAGKMAEKAIGKAQAARLDETLVAEQRANIIGGSKGWAAYGAFDKDDRRKALDDLGFARQLVFSTFAQTQFASEKDAKLRYGGARAHNRAMGEFCSGDPRLMGIAVVPLDTPELAVEEIRNAAKFGNKAIWINASPAGDRSPGHGDLDPVWQTMVELNLPFMLHIGGGTRVMPKAYDNNGLPRPTDWLGGGENLRVKDYMTISFAAQMFLSAMVFDCVFERFPGLKGGAIELGAGWVPHFLRSLDAGQRMFRKTDPQVGTLSLKASDYIRRQVRFTPFPGEDVGAMIRDAGDELFLFSSDYPHPEGGKDPVRKFDETLEGLSAVTVDKFYRRNFEDMMNLSAA
ncbi:MAG: amidohydrolase family protein [Proteobacteria bacterium]|nr:amidohydrolase family protein [Pseudomonadota bacterium]